ncbi:MAG TPA: hypothetical protein VLF19_00870 [Methylomirabilota bacterium]|nr:hypothetical protein [Methylomirabilota bacterium]
MRRGCTLEPMKPAGRWITVSVLVAGSVALLAGAVPAQHTTSQGTDLEQQMRKRRFVVLPKPGPEAVTQDVDRATEALAARRGFDDVVRESRSPIGRRPNLDYDVKSGIQSRSVQGLGLVPLRP